MSNKIKPMNLLVFVSLYMDRKKIPLFALIWDGSVPCHTVVFTLETPQSLRFSVMSNARDNREPLHYYNLSISLVEHYYPLSILCQ